MDNLDSTRPERAIDMVAELARQTGCVTQQRGHGDEDDDEDDDDDGVADTTSSALEGMAAPTSRGTQICRILADIANVRQEIEKVEADVQKRKMDRMFSDVTSLAEQERKCAIIESMTTNVTSTLNSKDRLVDRLQKPFVGDHMVVEASYQKAVVQLFPLLATSLTAFTSHVDALTWSGNCDEGITDLVATLHKLKGTSAAVEGVLRMRHQCRRTVRNFAKAQADRATPGI